MTAPLKARAQFLAVNAKYAHLTIPAQVSPQWEMEFSVDVSPPVRH
jgi:hypothetical protein